MYIDQIYCATCVSSLARTSSVVSLYPTCTGDWFGDVHVLTSAVARFMHCVKEVGAWHVLYVAIGYVRVKFMDFIPGEFFLTKLEQESQ